MNASLGHQGEKNGDQVHTNNFPTQLANVLFNVKLLSINSKLPYSFARESMKTRHPLHTLLNINLLFDKSILSYRLDFINQDMK